MKTKGIQVYYPPQPAPSTDLFLAGSIEMGLADEWQDRICERLMNRGLDCTVANPRREDWDSSWEQSIYNEQFRDQVTWELDQLKRSSLIIMYLAPGTVSPISLLELGLYAQHNMIVFCPPGFQRKGNVDIVCARYGIQMVETEDALINYVADYLAPSDLLTIPMKVIEKVGGEIIKKDDWSELVADLPDTGVESSAAGIINEMGRMQTAKIAVNQSAADILTSILKSEIKL